jgi:DNA-binding CsgD family transcriptional regulator
MNFVNGFERINAMPGTHHSLHAQSDHHAAVLNLENMLRELLYTAGFDEAFPNDASFTVVVCVDGRMYNVIVMECTPEADARPALSPRELDVVQLITKGLPNKTIASVLELSLSTVNTYTKRIYFKLNVNSRAEMVAKVMRTPTHRFYGSRPPGQTN